MDTRDSNTIKAMLTANFESIDIQGGNSNADSMIAELAKVPVDPSRKRQTTIDGVSIQDAEAKVAQHYDTSFERLGPDGIHHAIQMRARSNDIWVRSGTKWLLKKTETREMSITRDGQEIRHVNLD